MTGLSDNFKTVYEDRIHRTRERAASFIAVADLKLTQHYVQAGIRGYPLTLAHFENPWRDAIRQHLLKWCSTISERVATLREVRQQRGW